MVERRQSTNEEIANAVTHGLGLLASLAALPVLVTTAVMRGDDAAGVAGATVFGTALLLLYLASTVYHALPASRAKRAFQLLDHVAIYLLIAGTYTPFTLGALRGAWGWSLFGVVWGLALAGIAFELLAGTRFQRLSTALYLLKGWLVLIAVVPLVERVPAAGLVWLLIGGLLYTVGVWFFVQDHRRYRHAIWHLFVLGGSTCHFFAVLWYAA